VLPGDLRASVAVTVAAAVAVLCQAGECDQAAAGHNKLINPSTRKCLLSFARCGGQLLSVSSPHAAPSVLLTLLLLLLVLVLLDVPADAARMQEQVPVLACDKPINLHATPLMV
jgi:hypothetical protein